MASSARTRTLLGHQGWPSAASAWRWPTWFWSPPPGRREGQASWLWLAAFFAIISVGELYLFPPSLSLISKVAPARFISLLMGMWLATSFTGNFVGGWLGSHWSGMDKVHFFVMVAGVAAAAGLAIWAFDRPLRRALG